MGNNIEIIKKGETILAIIVSRDFTDEGIHFFSPEDFPQQLGFIRRAAGEVVQAHIHNRVKREVERTQETILVKKGTMKVHLYDEEKQYVASRVLKAGDVILLAAGGHEMKFLEETEMFEIKQGPYLAKEDKMRFSGQEEP